MRRNPFSRFAIGAAAIGALLPSPPSPVMPSRAAEDAVKIPPPAADAQAADGIQTAVLSGGCFWGVQGVFRRTASIASAVSGYAGGSQMTATYQQVWNGNTGHAKSVQVKYDPKKISLRRDPANLLLGRARPDPAQPPSPDSGTQYRSAIFAASDEQKKVADAYIAQLNAAKVYLCSGARPDRLAPIRHLAINVTNELRQPLVAQDLADRQDLADVEPVVVGDAMDEVAESARQPFPGRRLRSPSSGYVMSSFVRLVFQDFRRLRSPRSSKTGSCPTTSDARLAVVNRVGDELSCATTRWE